MARAYKKTYLNGAMRNLAVMFDCGVRKYGFSIHDFYNKFLSCDVSRQFANGNPRYLVGVSGAELADMVVQKSEVPSLRKTTELTPLDQSIGPVGYWPIISGIHVAVLHICRNKAWESMKSSVCITLYTRPI